jgi:hypothetical protein
MEQRAKAATPEKIASMYGIPSGTLANMRYRREGPKFFKCGRRVVYFFDDVENWLRQNPVLTRDDHES